MKYLVIQAFWYWDKVTGEFSYRIRDPGEALNTHPQFIVRNIHVFHPLFPQLAMQADLLVLHLMPDAEIFQVIQQRRRMNKPTVFEIADNFLSPGDWVPKTDAYRDPLVRQHFMEYASISSALQFSSFEVQKTFGFLNPNNMVFENQIRHFSKKSPASRPFVLGWGGSKGHEEDLARVAPVIRNFLERHQDAQFHFMGYKPMFMRLFKTFPAEQVRFVKAGPIEEWFQFLEGLHVGIAPLSNTEFNRCRSDVKFLEYAAHHTVPILSKAAPYLVHGRHEENALFYNDNAHLDQLLEDLYQHPEKTGTLADHAFRYANRKRSLYDHTGKKASFYQSLLKHQPFTTEFFDIPDCDGLIAYLRKATDSYTRDRMDEACQYLDRVLMLHPTYAQAHIWRAKVLVASGRFAETLEQYGAFKTDPIYNDLLMESLTVAAKALRRPEWRQYWERIANPVLSLYQAPVEANQVASRLRDILKLNPYDYKALVDLGVLLYKEGDPDCLEYFERAAFLDPESEQLRQVTTGLRASPLPPKPEAKGDQG